jgi:hypothetical protein
MLNRASLVARLARLEKRTYGVGAIAPRAIINLIVDGEGTRDLAPRHGFAVINLTIGSPIQDPETDPD